MLIVWHAALYGYWHWHGGAICNRSQSDKDNGVKCQEKLENALVISYGAGLLSSIK